MFDSIVKLDAAVKHGDNSLMAGIKQFNEEEALQRAMAVFWQRGFGATSMQDLAQATGVLRGSLYHAYGDKQAIFLRVYERYKAAFLEAARAALDLPDVAAALRSFFAYTIESMRTAPAIPGEQAPATRGCLTTKTAIDETAADEAIRLALRGLLNDLAQLLERRLSAPDALPRLKLPPKEAAILAVTLTRGIVVMERVYEDPAQLQAIADSLVNLLLSS
jgi:AcrR family transcriptional regulator